MIQKTPSHNTLSRRAFGLTLVAGLCAAVTAHAADGPLQLAFYAPSAPLPSAEARYAFTEKLAQALQSSGLQVQTKIFAKPGDFEAAIKKGAVDLAILDAVYAAERGKAFGVDQVLLRGIELEQGGFGLFLGAAQLLFGLALGHGILAEDLDRARHRADLVPRASTLHLPAVVAAHDGAHRRHDLLQRQRGSARAADQKRRTGKVRRAILKARR